MSTLHGPSCKKSSADRCTTGRHYLQTRMPASILNSESAQKRRSPLMSADTTSNKGQVSDSISATGASLNLRKLDVGSCTGDVHFSLTHAFLESVSFNYLPLGVLSAPFTLLPVLPPRLFISICGFICLDIQISLFASNLLTAILCGLQCTKTLVPYFIYRTTVSHRYGRQWLFSYFQVGVILYHCQVTNSESNRSYAISYHSKNLNRIAKSNSISPIQEY
jgi:hypothetical protein